MLKRRRAGSSIDRYALAMMSDSQVLAEIGQYFETLVQAERFSGVVRLTQGDSVLMDKGYGWASRAWRIPNATDTRFDTASLTKLFTAIATLQLIDEGAFALDSQVMPYLGIQGAAISDAVTVFQLLTHSSGIGDDAEEEDGEDYADLWKDRPNYAVRQTEDFLPQFIRKPPNFPPGEGCRYCNCSFVLLGLMIEKATGMTYRDAVQKRIFEPVGMRQSGFLDLECVNENLADGSDPIRDDSGGIVAWKRNIYSFPPIGSPDSGAHVTAEDLDHFLRAVRRGELLSDESTKLFFTPQIPYRTYDEWEAVYGTGLWFRVEPDERVIFCQKEGYNAGVSAIMRYYVESDINVVILSNMAEGAWAPARWLHERVLRLAGIAR